MKNKASNHGQQMYEWAEELFPIYRCLTGDGVRETLNYISQILPDLEVKSVQTGVKAFDWEVPKEWEVFEAYIEDTNGLKIIDFKENNLHLVGYSQPIDQWIGIEELQSHLHSLPDQPNAIPYVTSYYSENWGFCLTHSQRKELTDSKYHVVIKSRLFDGSLNYGELIIPGTSKKEVLLSTYICHPSMANNEVSGPVVSSALGKWLSDRTNNFYTYRIIFIPETIGSIVYLSKNLEHLKRSVIAGFNITCVGDNKCYSLLPSRNGSTLSDRVARHTLKHIEPNFTEYSWLKRGSDERQYCAPGIDLPITSIMRSKYGEYDEYHTSLDDLTFISPEGLNGGFEAIKKSILAIEHNRILHNTVLCEPQLGKRNLYQQISKVDLMPQNAMVLNLLSYSDGTNDLLKIADIIGVPILELYKVAEELIAHNLLKEIKQ
jgi:aminopeptidase-like protein